MTETKTCKKCGGEGHLVCRPNIRTLIGELYTVDCEDCYNTTANEHADPEKAIEQWNSVNDSLGQQIQPTPSPQPPASSA